MTQEQINKGIIENLSRAAHEYFNRITKEYGERLVKSGTYTAAEIAKGKPFEISTISVNWLKLDNSGDCKISVGTFKCEFPMYMIFEVLDKFEKLAKIPTAKKSKFTYSANVESIAEFIITFPKATKELAKQVSKDTFRPQLCKICIDTENAALVATDTKVLSEVRAEVDMCSGEHCKILIDTKTAKAIAGKSAIVEVGEDGKAVITVESGETYEGETTQHFPDYRRVLPKVSRKGYIKFGKNAIKEFTKFCKLNGGNIEMHIIKGSTEVRLKSYLADDGEMKLQSEVTLQMESASQCEGGLMFDSEVFLRVAQWDGGIWLANGTRPIVFDCKGMEYTIIMPLAGTRIEIDGEVIPCMERNTMIAENSTGETMPVVTEVAIEPRTEVVPSRAENVEIEHTEVVADISATDRAEADSEDMAHISAADASCKFAEIHSRVPIDSVIRVEKSEVTPKTATAKFTDVTPRYIPTRNNSILSRKRRVLLTDRAMYHLGRCVPYRANMAQITRVTERGCSIEVVGKRAREPGD